MKILVHPHDLGIGGSQLNAIEIAAAVARLGHPTIVFGPPGPLTDRIAELGLEFVAAPEPRRRPSPATVGALVELIDARGIDVLHGYEWPPALECLLAARRRKVAAVATVMSMSVAPFLPHRLPLVVGTEQIAAVERAKGRPRTFVLEPPVDLVANQPDTGARRAAFGQRWRLAPDRATVVCVSRLARELKLEGLLAAMAAVAELNRTVPTQLVIVGDGPARDEVRRHAAQIDARAGAGTVVLTGELADPRDAYAAADVVLGMGGSALRAMAFGKPVVVQGEQGFWRLLTPETAAGFRWTGWYGRGTDTAGGADRLREILLEVLPDAQQRRQLGGFALSVVQEHHSLEAAAAKQLDVYAAALDQTGGGGHVADDVAAVARFVGHHARRRTQRALGRRASDDFNANPVAGDPAAGRDGALRPSAPAAPASPASPERGALVWISGASWDAVAGTDRHLVTALAEHRPVIWVDPPMSWLARRRRGVSVGAVTRVAPSIVRLHTVAPPGVGRPGIRTVSRWLMWRQVRRAVPALADSVAAVVATSPEPVLRHRPIAGELSVYFATDDFVAGADLLGYSTRYARRTRRANVRHADLVLAVSQTLADSLAETLPRDTNRVRLLPNGCCVDHYSGVAANAAPRVKLDRPIAGMVGQLNDRIDIDLLEAVADAGDSLLLVGPRYEQQEALRDRIDRLLERTNVEWVGRQHFDSLPGYLAVIDVGLTPYTDTAFNRASFPLKTLEYLAAGRPVVSTDLPSARALATDLIVRASGPGDFSDAVHRLLTEPACPDLEYRRRAFARHHDWSARAAELLELIDTTGRAGRTRRTV